MPTINNASYTYTGDVANGMPNGRGKMIWMTDNSVYEGDFVNGRYHGKGRWILPSGAVYEGDFVGHVQHGRGKLMRPDGSVLFEGNFVNGEPDIG